MKIAIIGTGYVAAQYATTLSSHPRLKLVGAYDRHPDRLERFSSLLPMRKYASVQEVLDDSSVQTIVNLTNPRSHLELNQRSLEAGKHVYSEKPLAMTADEARML